MRTVLKYSVNTYAVQLLDMVGVRTALATGQKMGLSLVDSGENNDLKLASLALGG